MAQIIRYPIGQQDFKTLRDRDCVYVDKTPFIRELVDNGGQYFFLARPRRFGKSLFLSTLEYFFRGERDLFKGLDVDTADWDWQWEEYPVLRLDLNTDRYAEPGQLDGVLDNLLRGWEKRYGITPEDTQFSQRFKTVIETAHKKTGKKVVILVDEYDKPLVGNLNKPEAFEAYRSQLASLYSNFKSGGAHIRLVFLTGVSRFSKLSVFSDLNNIQDITFDNEYADICGITREEVVEYFKPGIEALAEAEQMTYEETRQALKENYDGYRFAKTGSEIYNPWSLLNALSKKSIGNYWNETGMPTIVAESLKLINADLKEFFDITCTEDDLQGMDLLNPNPIALMYQTGYLTIMDYDKILREYTLGIPNKEVKYGLYKVLLPYYVKEKALQPSMIVRAILRGFVKGKPEVSMEAMRVFFAGIDYDLKIENENNFQNAFYLLIHIIGLNTKAEAHTSDGRIDILIQTNDYVYIIELKYDHSAEEALRQIEEKEYALPFRADGRRVYKIGASFSSKTRRIDSWVIA